MRLVERFLREHKKLLWNKETNSCRDVDDDNMLEKKKRVEKRKRERERLP
jgi:hypothetical protein